MKTHVQLILYALAAVVISVGIGILNDKWKEGQQARAIVEESKPINQAATDTINEGVIAQTAQKAYELGVNRARDEFKQQQAEDKRHEPETAARADRAVPRSVLNNFAKRRAARERLGCVSGECPDAGEQAEATKR